MRGATYFDTTQLPSTALPLDTEDAIIGLTPGDEELALWDLGNPTRFDETLHERTHDRFARRVKKLAAALIAGTLTLLAWHRLMRDEVKTHAIQQAIIGGGGTLADTLRVSGLIRRETDYLSRFADEIAREGITSPRLRARAEMYGGSGRAVYYREKEEQYPPGYVIEYIAKDDDATCDPCTGATGFYLPGGGPFPGEVCFGRSRCRCTRVARFDEGRYQWLKTRSPFGR